MYSFDYLPAANALAEEGIVTEAELDFEGQPVRVIRPECLIALSSSVAAKLRNDAAAQPASYGFVGDPSNPITTGGPNPKTLYYGYLVKAGIY